MNHPQNAAVPTRDILIEILDKETGLSLKEIIEKVKERKEVKDKSIRKEISGLTKMGLIVGENTAGGKSYKKAKEPLYEKPVEEYAKLGFKKPTATETEALRSVVERIAPLLIDAEENASLYDLLGRVYDLDKLLQSHGLPNGYMSIARLCMDFFQRYSDVFVVDIDRHSSNPLRALISVKDPLGLLFVRYIYDDKEIKQLQYFRDKQDCFAKTAIENVERQNEIVVEIDRALKNNPSLRYIARILALKRASPRWIFGYEFKKAIDDMNALLSESNLRFEVENQDRLRIVIKCGETHRNQARLKH